MTPLLESKRFIESFQQDNSLPICDERIRQFLNFLEARDFGAAAARLLDDVQPGLPSDAISHTIRIAQILDIDVTALEVPAAIGITLCDSPHAQAIVCDRTQAMIRQRMIDRLVQRGTELQEAEILIDDARSGLLQGKPATINPLDVSLEELDPQLARVVRLLLGPVPLEKSSSIPHPAANEPANDAAMSPAPSGLSDDRRAILIRRIGKFAAILYGLIAIIAIAFLAYSYSGISQVLPFSLPKELSISEQEAKIAEWATDNLPATKNWFIASPADHFFPVKLEPNLPVAYDSEKWSWEKRVDSINSSATELVARLKRCHEQLFVLYFTGVLVAILHWSNQGIVSSLLMILLGVLGIPSLVHQVWNSEFENSLWLGPLVIPGLVALMSSVSDLVLVAPRTDQRKELRGFWLGATAFAITGGILVWAILDGSHLRTWAGTGFFGGAWLMLHHGWRYFRSRVVK